MKLKEGNSAQAHVKEMTELFDFLSVAGETVSEEDRVVYLLASLPESYNVLVTALEPMKKFLNWKWLQNEFFIRKGRQRIKVAQELIMQ